MATAPIQVYLRVRPNAFSSGTERSVEVGKDGRNVMLYQPQNAQGFTQSLRTAAAAAAATTLATTAPVTTTTLSHTGLPITNADPDDPQTTTTRNPQHTFTFDHVFPPTTDQSTVYQQVALPLLNDLVSGYNATLLLYGNSGSGKTYTAFCHEQEKLSDPTAITNTSQHGLLPRFAQGIFDHIAGSDGIVEFTIKVSLVEVYNEQIADLLSGKQNLKLRDSNNLVWIDDLTHIYVNTVEELLATIEVGRNNRTTTSTTINDVSSRSHIVVRIIIGQNNTQTGEKRGSVLTIVDLAGSEKQKNTNSSGAQLKEAQHINKSLSALGNVINASASNLPHIPFRDSIITHLLRDSIGGSSKTRIILTASPNSRHYDETLSTCRFGQRASAIKNKPILNRERSIEEYKTWLLTVFRLIIKRTKLLKKSYNAIECCVAQHPQNQQSSAFIYTTHSTMEPLSLDHYYALKNGHHSTKDFFEQLVPPGHHLHIPTNIKELITELCDHNKDRDLLSFIHNNTLYFPEDAANDEEMLLKKNQPLTTRATATMYDLGDDDDDDYDINQNNSTRSRQHAQTAYNNNGCDDDDFEGLLNSQTISPENYDATQYVPQTTTSTFASSSNNNNNNNNNHNTNQNNQQQQHDGKQKKNSLVSQSSGDDVALELQSINNKLLMAQNRVIKTTEQMKELECQHGLRVMELQTHIDDLEREMFGLKTEITDSYLHQHQLSEHIAKLEVENKQFQTEKDQHNQVLFELNTQLEKFTTLLRQKDVTIKTLCDESSAQQEQQLRQQNDSMVKLEKLQYKLKEQQLLFDKKQEKYALHDAEQLEMKNVIAALQLDIVKHATARDEVTVKVNALQNELYQRQKELTQTQQQLNQKTQEVVLHQQTLQDLKATITDLTNKLTAERQKHQDLLHAYRLLQEKLNQFQIEKDLAAERDEQRLIDDLKAQNIELQKLFTTISTERDGFKQQMFDIGEQYRAMKLEKHAVEQNVAVLQSRLHDNDAIIKARSELILKYEEQCKQQQAELVEVDKKYQEAQRKSDKVSLDYDNMMKKYFALNDEYKHKENTIQMLQTNHAALQKKLGDLEVEYSSNNTSANSLMLSSSSSSNNNNNTSDNNNNNNNVSIDNNNSQISTPMSTTNNTTTTSFTPSEFDLERKTLKATILQYEVKLNTLQTELSTTLDQKAILEQQIQQIKTDMTYCDQQNQQLFKTKQDNETKIAELEAQLKRMRARFQAFEDSSAERFKGFEQEKQHLLYTQQHLLSENKRLQHDWTDAQHKLQQRMNIEQQINSQQDQLKYKYDSLVSKHDGTQKELNAKTAAYNTLFQTYQHEKEEVNIELKKAQEEHLALQVQLQELKDITSFDKQQLIFQADEHKIVVNDLNQQVALMQQQLLKKQEEFTQMEAKLAAQQQQALTTQETLQKELALAQTQAREALLKQHTLEQNQKDLIALHETRYVFLQQDHDKLKQVHTDWREQHEALYQEKCQNYTINIQSLETLTKQQQEEIFELKTMLTKQSEQQHFLLQEQNKHHNLELVELKNHYQQQINQLQQDKQDLAAQNQHLDLSQQQLQDAVSVHQQEMACVESKLKKSEEKINSLQIQWEVNIHQQLQFDDETQFRITTLEQQLMNNNIYPISHEECQELYHNRGQDGGDMLLSSATGGNTNNNNNNNNNNKDDKKGFFGKKEDSKTNNVVMTAMRQEIKQYQQVIEQNKVLLEKKEKQYQRMNNNFLQKTKDYEDLAGQYDGLKQQYEDVLFDIQELQKLFESPEEIALLRQQNVELKSKVEKLQDANKLLLLTEYNNNKRDHGHATTRSHHAINANSFKTFSELEAVAKKESVSENKNTADDQQQNADQTLTTTATTNPEDVAITETLIEECDDWLVDYDDYHARRGATRAGSIVPPTPAPHLQQQPQSSTNDHNNNTNGNPTNPNVIPQQYSGMNLFF